MVVSAAAAALFVLVMTVTSAATAFAVMMVVIVSATSACVSAGYHTRSYLILCRVAFVENLNLKLQIFACIRVVKIDSHVVFAYRFYYHAHVLALLALTEKLHTLL